MEGGRGRQKCVKGDGGTAGSIPLHGPVSLMLVQ